jgi:hypothetical protein
MEQCDFCHYSSECGCFVIDGFSKPFSDHCIQLYEDGKYCPYFIDRDEFEESLSEKEWMKLSFWFPGLVEEYLIAPLDIQANVFVKKIWIDGECRLSFDKSGIHIEKISLSFWDIKKSHDQIVELIARAIKKEIESIENKINSQKWNNTAVFLLTGKNPGFIG